MTTEKYSFISRKTQLWQNAEKQAVFIRDCGLAGVFLCQRVRGVVNLSHKMGLPLDCQATPSTIYKCPTAVLFANGRFQFRGDTVDGIPQTQHVAILQSIVDFQWHVYHPPFFYGV